MGPDYSLQGRKDRGRARGLLASYATVSVRGATFDDYGPGSSICAFGIHCMAILPAMNFPCILLSGFSSVLHGNPRDIRCRHDAHRHVSHRHDARGPVAMASEWGIDSAVMRWSIAVS